MKDYSKAFKRYDIRGIRQEEIDEEFGFLYGYSMGLYIKENVGDAPKILLTSDTRTKNITLIDAILEGFGSAGISEVEICGIDDRFGGYPYGICSTPIAYYITYHTYDYWIGLSASHNDARYVGIKPYDINCFNTPTSILKELFFDAMEKKDQIIRGKKATVITVDQKEKLTHLQHDIAQKFSTLTQIPNFSIDYGHGASVHYERDWMQAMNLPISELFITPDGEFPAHETDTSRDSNYLQLHQDVVEKGNAFGFMFDGDADRMGLILPNGSIIRGDIILSIVAKQLLTDGTAERLGSNIVYYEVFCSRVVKKIVEQYGGVAKMCKIGRGVFAKEVVEDNALLAGEVSTHLLMKEYGMIEMPLVVLYYLLKEAENYPSFSDMIAAYQQFVGGQVYHFKATDKEAIIEQLKSDYSDYPQVTIDGVRVEGPNWWFTVRTSGTEPIIKVAIEGETQEIYETILGKIREKMIKSGAHEE